MGPHTTSEKFHQPQQSVLDAGQVRSACPRRQVHLPAQPSWAGPLSTLDPFQMWCWWPAVAVSMAVLDARAHTCLLLAGRPATWGWKACAAQASCHWPRHLGRASHHRQGDWPAHLLPHLGNPETGLPPLTPRSVPISQSLGLGARVCCGAWVGACYALLRRCSHSPSWASQLGHSVSCNDALSKNPGS